MTGSKVRRGGKILSLSAAVQRFVVPSSSIHFAYGGARPNAAVAEIVRQFSGTDPGFTVSAHGFVSTHHALLARGLISHLCVAFAGENYPSPRPNPVLQRALAERSVTIENWSIWSLTARLIAGALGVDGFPIRSLADSGIADEHSGVGYLPSRSDDGSGMVAALRPDIVLLHGLAGDDAGNVILAAPYGEGIWGAMAAKTGVIACVERVVSQEEMRRYNAWPQVPAHTVCAVCEVPGGSHPYGLWAGGFPGVATYAEDGPFMAELRRAARDPATFSAWIDEWIVRPGDNDGYWRKLAARPHGSSAQTAEAKNGPTPNEWMTVVAARIIERRIHKVGYNSVIGGIGFAHLAAWVASERLAADGIPIQLLAELGMAGIVPKEGDPYLFANQNLATCAQLTDVAQVLGTLVAGPRTRCLGVLGAGEIDVAGNLNSTWSRDGRFLVGSGGANDVASAADEVIVVVRQDAARLVKEVGYITAPGRLVSTIVTTEAIFERRSDGFVVTASRFGSSVTTEELRRQLQGRTGWELKLADTVEEIPSPTAAELSALRSFDPRAVFLKG